MYVFFFSVLGLKKVTPDMQTHKNAQLRSGPAPFITPQPYSKPATASSAPVAKTNAKIAEPPVFALDGKKWKIEYQNSNNNMKIENAEMNNVVYMYKCVNSTLTVTGKVNNIIMDSCKKCSVLLDSVVSSVEFVNCQSVQMQVNYIFKKTFYFHTFNKNFFYFSGSWKISNYFN